MVKETVLGFSRNESTDHYDGSSYYWDNNYSCLFSNIGCKDNEIAPQDYTVTNMLGYDVKVFTGDGRDPTGLIPDGVNTDYGDSNTWSCAREDPVLQPIHSETGVLPSGKTVTFTDALLSGWSFYIVEARDFTDGQMGRHVFIRKFTWKELEA